MKRIVIIAVHRDMCSYFILYNRWEKQMEELKMLSEYQEVKVF